MQISFLQSYSPSITPHIFPKVFVGWFPPIIKCIDENAAPFFYFYERQGWILISNSKYNRHSWTPLKVVQKSRFFELLPKNGKNSQKLPNGVKGWQTWSKRPMVVKSGQKWGKKVAKSDQRGAESRQLQRLQKLGKKKEKLTELQNRRKKTKKLKNRKKSTPKSSQLQRQPAEAKRRQKQQQCQQCPKVAKISRK